jgi:hypothetical protein
MREGNTAASASGWGGLYIDGILALLILIRNHILNREFRDYAGPYEHKVRVG